MDREQREQRRVNDRERETDEERPARLVAKRDAAAEHGSDAERGGDDGPRSCTAQKVLRDDRTEDCIRSEHERVREQRVEVRPDQPRARLELTPPVGEVVQQRLGGQPLAGRQVQPGQEPRADAERDGVEAERVPGPTRRHEDAGERRAEDRAERSGCRPQSIRLLEPFRAHRLRDESRHRRVEERGRGPVDGDEREDLPELGDARDQERGEQALTHEPHHVRADHHRPTRQPVREDAAGEEEEHLRKRAGGRDEAEVRDRAGDVEDRERQRERDDPGAEPRDRLTEEEKPELALAERAETLGQPHGSRLLAERGRVRRPRV
jgi:hypothetical protein